MNDTEAFAKNKNKYIESAIVIGLLFFIPFIINKLFLFFMDGLLEKQSALLQAKAFAYIITCAYDIIIVWCGFLEASFEVVKTRIKAFFSTLFYIKLKDSIKFSLISIKNDGAFYWLYLAIILNHFLQMINAMKIFMH